MIWTLSNDQLIIPQLICCKSIRRERCQLHPTFTSGLLHKCKIKELKPKWNPLHLKISPFKIQSLLKEEIPDMGPIKRRILVQMKQV